MAWFYGESFVWESELGLASDLEEDLWHWMGGKLTAGIPKPKPSRNLELIAPSLDPMKLLP